MMDLYRVSNQRSVYTIWDWMGDIGGLYGSLFLIGDQALALITYLFGDSLSLKLISTIFKEEASKRHRSSRSLLNWLQKRKPASFSRCAWLPCVTDRKHRHLQFYAEDRISRELDIVEFLRHQLTDNI